MWTAERYSWLFAARPELYSASRALLVPAQKCKKTEELHHRRLYNIVIVDGYTTHALSNKPRLMMTYEDRQLAQHTTQKQSNGSRKLANLKESQCNLTIVNVWDIIYGPCSSDILCYSIPVSKLENISTSNLRQSYNGEVYLENVLL